MKKQSGIIIILTMFLLLTSICSGCNPSDPANEKQPENTAQLEAKGKINVYISGPQQMVDTLEAKFEENRGDVLEVFHTGCGPLRQKVWTEMESGAIQADVVWGAEPMMYIALKDKDQLLQYNSPQKENLCPEYQYGDGYYTAVNARYGAIVYNKEKVKSAEVPLSFADLTDKKWQGRIAMADATQSAMALALTAGLYTMQDNSWDYMEALKGNDLMLTKQNIEAVSRVESSEVDVAIVPHDGILRLMKKAKKQNIKSPLAICWPEEGAISCQRPIAIIQKEKRAEADEKLAEEFVDFTLSPVAQNIASKFGFISVRKDLDPPQGVPAQVKAVTVDWRYACDHESELRDGFRGIMFQ